VPEKNEIYLDNSATTRVFPEIADRIYKIMTEEYGNPSSIHGRGLAAEKLVDEARQTISSQLKIKDKELFFTSGGTESNNMAILGIAESRRRRGNHIICSAIEHASVLETVKQLGQKGYKIDLCPVNSEGIIDLDALVNLVDDGTILVTIMMVNNEVGSIQPIKDAVSKVKGKNPEVLFHTDAVQALGKMAVEPRNLGVDLLSVSAHKIHGPQGAGALYVKEGTASANLFWGGGQEMGLRPGTENVSGVMGFGMAVRQAYANLDEVNARMYLLKQNLIDNLNALKMPYQINGPDPSKAAPHIINLSFQGRGEILVRYLESKHIYVSTGSACTSRKTRSSHVLKAMGRSDKEAQGSIRISLSSLNKRSDIEFLTEALYRAVQLF
jgi:cysteine desulfurase